MKTKAEETYQAETNFMSQSYRRFDRALISSTDQDKKMLCDNVTSFWKTYSAGTQSEEPNKFSKDIDLALETIGKKFHHSGTIYEIGLLKKKTSNFKKLSSGKRPTKQPVTSALQRSSVEYQLSVLYNALLLTDIEKGCVKPVVFANHQAE